MISKTLKQFKIEKEKLKFKKIEISKIIKPQLDAVDREIDEIQDKEDKIIEYLNADNQLLLQLLQTSIKNFRYLPKDFIIQLQHESPHDINRVDFEIENNKMVAVEYRGEGYIMDRVKIAYFPFELLDMDIKKLIKDIENETI